MRWLIGLSDLVSSKACQDPDVVFLTLQQRSGVGVGACLCYIIYCMRRAVKGRVDEYNKEYKTVIFFFRVPLFPARAVTSDAHAHTHSERTMTEHPHNGASYVTIKWWAVKNNNKKINLIKK